MSSGEERTDAEIAAIIEELKSNDPDKRSKAAEDATLANKVMEGTERVKRKRGNQ